MWNKILQNNRINIINYTIIPSTQILFYMSKVIKLNTQYKLYHYFITLLRKRTIETSIHDLKHRVHYNRLNTI